MRRDPSNPNDDRLMPCWQCGQTFVFSDAQLLLLLRGKEVFCSLACREAYRAEHFQWSRCVSCGRSFIVESGQGFHDYLWDLEHNNFCSMTCLYTDLIREDRVSLSPQSAGLFRPKALLTADTEGRAGGVASSPQQRLFESLSATGGVSWILEYSIPTGVYQNNRPKRYRIDIACPERKVAVECDGKHHATRKMQLQDAVRDLALAELGWVTLRFTYAEINTDLLWCLEQIRVALEREEG